MHFQKVSLQITISEKNSKSGPPTYMFSTKHSHENVTLIKPMFENMFQ